MSTKPRYAIRFEKHVSGYTMTYSTHETFHDAAESLTKLKSINTIDYCYIDELYFKSGLNDYYTQDEKTGLCNLITGKELTK
jgi:uncharacterized protein YlbG (UPF0298 family)